MNKPLTIVSGARASGKLHIGNYLGALKQWVKLQDEGNKCFYFIADLHGMTTPFEPKDLSTHTLDVAATYLASGIDPNKTIFFLQNHILEHVTLAWVFQCITPLGELERMTQYKEKSEEHKTSSNAGLLTYPTLMAADILMYKPDAVPVGDDQVQHVELSRVIARKFNNRFGPTFPEPKHIIRDEKIARVKSLANPSKKMSKTGDEALLMDDEPEEIHRKIKKAVTSSDPSGESLGAKNLMYLLNEFGSEKEIKSFGSDQKLGKLRFSDLKETLSTRISEHFADFREKKKELLSRPDEIAEILGDGARRAREVAAATLLEVKEKIGLL